MCWTANSTWTGKFGRRRVRGAHGVFGSQGANNDTTATTTDTTTS